MFLDDLWRYLVTLTMAGIALILCGKALAMQWVILLQMIADFAAVFS